MSLGYFYIFWQSSLLETFVYFLFYRGRLSAWQIFLLVTAANAVTHPIVFFGFMASTLSYLWAILLAEAFAVGGETLLHRDGGAGRLSWGRVALAALAANLFSWQLAPALTYWLFLQS